MNYPKYVKRVKGTSNPRVTGGKVYEVGSISGRIVDDHGKTMGPCWDFEGFDKYWTAVDRDGRCIGGVFAGADVGSWEGVTVYEGGPAPKPLWVGDIHREKAANKTSLVDIIRSNKMLTIETVVMINGQKSTGFSTVEIMNLLMKHNKELDALRTISKIVESAAIAGIIARREATLVELAGLLAIAEVRDSKDD